MQADGTRIADISAARRLWVVCDSSRPEACFSNDDLTLIAEELIGDLDGKMTRGPATYATASKPMTYSVAVFRVPGVLLNQNVILFRIVNMIWLGGSILSKGLKKFRGGDRVLVVTSPTILPFVVAVAAIAKGSVYSLLVRGDNLIGIESNRTKWVSVIEFFNRWLYKSASKIIVVGGDMRQRVARKTSGLDVPIVDMLDSARFEAGSRREAGRTSLARPATLVKFTLEPSPGKQPAEL